MRNTKKWLVGLAVLALLFVSVAALAGTPKIYRGDNPNAVKNLHQRQASMNKMHPQAAAKITAKRTADPNFRNLISKNGSSEAYSLAGLGFSEGMADNIATNGTVACWSDDTEVLGNFTFAPANDIAHPTAYYVGYGNALPYPDSMQFVGNLLYVASDTTDVIVFDCTDVNNIQLVADFDMSCYVTDKIEDFRVKNGYLWVAIGYDGFLIYSLGNPSYPLMYGNWVHEGVNYGLKAFDPAGFDMYCQHIEVTDDTMILIDDTPTYGWIYLWDITNMDDPLTTITPYLSTSATRFRVLLDNETPPVPQNVALFMDGDDPALAPGMFESTYSGDYSYHGIQIKYVSGSIFVGNSLFNADLGVARFDWQEESNPDSLMAIWGAPVSINVAGPPFGRPRHINNFQVVGTGSFVFTSYEDVVDLPDIVGDSGEKWDWSAFILPTSLLTYKMDRFFFNNETNFAVAPLGGYNVFYGGAHVAFFAPNSGEFRALMAGWNYIASFDDSGMLVDHYVTGGNPEWWPLDSFHTPWNLFPPNPYSQPWYNLPAGATVWNHVATTDDKYTLVWEPEGVYFMDNSTGLRVGFWECPSNHDFVRTVAITSDNHYAFVAAGILGLITLDISDPTNPVEVGDWWTNPSTPTIDRQPVTYVWTSHDPAIPNIARYAYVQTRVIAVDAQNPHNLINKLRVLDISDPPLPAEVASYETAVGTYGGIPPATIYWDINNICLANAYTYLGHMYLQISNGQGIPLGMPLEMWNPAYSNNYEYYNYLPAITGAVGSFIVGDVTTPSAVANRFDASWQAVAPHPTLIAGTYCLMSIFYVPQDNSNYWAYIADGFAEVVDMGDPASGLTHTYSAPYGPTSFFPDPYGWGTVDIWGMGFPTYIDRIFRVYGANQIGTGYYFLDPVFDFATLMDGWDHWDVSLPLGPFYLPAYGSNSVLNWEIGNWFEQLSDYTWLTTDLFGNVYFFVNKPDYIAPAFTTNGPNDDGWMTPYCGSLHCGIWNAPMELKVQVIDNVAVTRVRMRAYYDNGDNWDGCAPGYTALGNAAGPDSDNFWTLTVDPSQMSWSGWVEFEALANDAGGNISSEVNSGGLWFVAALPTIAVTVGPAGTDAPYVWSTTSVDAQVTTVQGDPHVVRVLFKVDGLSIGDGVYNPSTDRWYTSWDTTLLTDGNHTVTAEVTTGNSAVAVSAPVTKYVANFGPDSYLITPVAGSMVYGSSTLSAALTNATYPVPIDHVDFVLDRPAGASSGGTVIATATAPVSPGGPYNATFDFSTIPDGNHTLISVFYDKRWDGTKRSKPSAWVSFSKVTPTPIIATIAANPSSPMDNQTVMFTSTVSGGITPYTYSWSSSPAGLTGTGPTAAWKFSAGTYTITLQVTDSLATVQTATMNLTVTPSVLVNGVVKAANPFRLKVTGTGFISGCVIKINGTAVTTVYKSTTLVVAKGCKPLCPKGTQVQVTVTNPDGTTSNAFPFTR